MRLYGLMLATLCAAFLNTTYTYAQGSDAHPAEEQQLEPYHKHRDTRHGHDHSYPDRGSVIRDLPRGTIGVSYAGVSYRFHDGVWLEPRGPAFIVVAPPIGLVVPNLPSFTTVLAQGGQTFLYTNNVYYRPRPDLGGYEVVNDPLDTASQAAAETSFTGGQVPRGAASAPLGTSPPATSSQAATFAVLPAASVATTPTAVAPTATPLAQATVATSATPATSAASVAPAIAGPAATMRLATPAVGPPVPPSSAPPAEAPPATPPAPMLAIPVLAAAPAVPTPNATVAPATGSAATSQSARGSKVFIYPKNGQNPDQQARDRYDCYRFAVTQSGLDPMHPGGAATANAELQSDFDRAQSACFDARGYTTR